MKRNRFISLILAIVFGIAIIAPGCTAKKNGFGCPNKISTEMTP